MVIRFKEHDVPPSCQTPSVVVDAGSIRRLHFSWFPAVLRKPRKHAGSGTDVLSSPWIRAVGAGAGGVAAGELLGGGS
jgi:hypothetical protein